jgi:phosphatidylinositol alpha-1,6-mannosyltransferase
MGRAVARPRPEALLLTPDFPPAPGGAQRLLHRLAADAARVGFRVVTTARAGAPGSDEHEPFAIRRVRAPRTQTAAVLALNAAGVVEGLRRRPDVIVSGHIVTSPAAAILAAVLRRPVVQYVYAIELAARPRLARFAASRADFVIALSEYAQGLAVAAGALPERVRIVAPGVDAAGAADITAARRAPGQDGRPPRIVTVARLGERYKGHDVLARALPLVRARVPGVEWVVVGDGPLRGHIEDLVRSHGVGDAVRMTGAVDDDERDLLLAEADVFAMPSRVPPGGAGEGFGIAYLEAGLRGLPVVAGAAGGALDAVEDGKTGLLVDPTDHVAVAEALIALLVDPELAARLGRAGAERAQQFGWATMVRSVEDVLLEACESPR